MTPERFELIETPMADLHLIQRKQLRDERGYFERMFCTEDLKVFGWDCHVAQVNRTLTLQTGSVRGLHMLITPREAKLITCLKGKVWDLVLDLRRGSPTFLSWYGVELDADSGRSLLIPPGFAHGFQTLSDNVEMLYFHSCHYQPDSELGVNVADPLLDIKWPRTISMQSEKDRGFPFLPNGFKGVKI